MHTQSLIVAFGYKARSGKDTAVSHLVETYKDKYDVRRYAFADQVKVECYDLLNNWRAAFWSLPTPFNFLTMPHPVELSLEPATLEQKVAWVNKNRSGDLGRMLQYFATDYRRRQQPFYWVQSLASRIAKDNPQVALISDMRFKNEYYWVASNGGYTVKTTRVGYQLDDGRDPNHPSENDLNDIKFHFDIQVPDGGEPEINELRKDAAYVFERILEVYQQGFLSSGLEDQEKSLV